MSDVKLCECGCGKPTAIRDGKPNRFVNGHGYRGKGKPTLGVRRGDAFNRLTVLEDAVGARTKTRCRCECGTECAIRVDYLRNGHTRSCGCLKLEVARAQPKVGVKAGTVFGRWTVLEDTEGRSNPAPCRCECGVERAVDFSNLTRGWSLSCGCYAVERSVQACTTHGHTAGGSTPTYGSWAGLRSRCTRPTNAKWKEYGGRGITVCARWLGSFEAFLADMGEKPDWANGGIDRIDNDGGYWCGRCDDCLANDWPSNCRWATNSMQRANQRKRKAA